MINFFIVEIYIKWIFASSVLGTGDGDTVVMKANKSYPPVVLHSKAAGER